MTHLPKPRKPIADSTALILFLGVAALALGLSMLTMPPKQKVESAQASKDAPMSYQEALHEAELQSARDKAEQVQHGAAAARLEPETPVKSGAASPQQPFAAPAGPSKAEIRSRTGSVRSSSEPVKVLEQVRPDYPSYARAARVQGAVEVRVLVDRRGVPVRASVLSGPAALREQALLAAEAWRFSPARRDGRPVAAPYTLRFDFRLA
ncbi:MAG TPA: TonB family protein [Holophagaceae bacterium]|nr:TonB family protein [Holophagaceae bacterium]